MPWKETSVMAERIQFVVEAMEGGVPFARLCRCYGISRPTGYRWLNRCLQQGSFQALREKCRRPHSSPTRTPAKLEAEVVALRNRYGWGARKLKVLLGKEGIELPGITIHRIIKRHGLVAVDRSHPPATKRFQKDQPNQLWQMDFKGHYSFAGGRCHPLSILDDNSRFVVGLHALPDQKADGVNACLVRTFENYGLPEALLMDHGVPWWSTTNGHGLTWVSIALLKQGIRLCFGRIRHPQTQGKVERFNRTVEEAVSHRGKPDRLAAWRSMLDEIRDEYNHVRPHEALDMHPPASRYEPSGRPYMPHPPEWQYPPDSIVRRLNTQGCLDYKRRRLFVCEALAGEHVRIQHVGDQLLVSFRDMYIREIDLAHGRTRALVLPCDTHKV